MIVRGNGMEVNKVLTVTEAASELRVSPSFVREHLEDLGAFRCGRVYRIPSEGIAAFIRSQRVHQTPEVRPLASATRAKVFAATARMEVLGCN
jgi:excisionase family DNA binding protein